MANNAHTSSHSQTPFENNSPNPSARNFASLSDTGGVNGGQPQPVVVTPTPPSRRPRGRPPGSKNKPKAPIIIGPQGEDSVTTVAIQITPGNDVINTIVAFAHRHHVDITVVSATGLVSNVTLCQDNVPSSRGSIFPIHGTFRIVFLFGSYVIGSQFSSFFSTSLSNPTFVSSLFSALLVGSQGQAFSGVIAGRFVASTAVWVTANICKKPRFFNLSFINGDFYDQEGGDGDADDVSEDNDNNNNNNKAAGGVITNSGQHSRGVKIVSSAIPNNNMMLEKSSLQKKNVM